VAEEVTICKEPDSKEDAIVVTKVGAIVMLDAIWIRTQRNR
jgi:hypothetical protein